MRSTLLSIGRCPKFGAGFYGRYLEELDRVIQDELGHDERSCKRRDFERALYTVGGRQHLLGQLSSRSA